jgi:hypothetical protein
MLYGGEIFKNEDFRKKVGGAIGSRLSNTGA